MGGEECGDDCLEELFGLFWVDLSKDTGVDFGVSGIVLDLAAGFLLGLSGVLSGVLGEDGVVTDGVEVVPLGVLSYDVFLVSLW